MKSLVPENPKAIFDHGSLADTTQPGVNPAILYLASLSNGDSRASMVSTLNRVASLAGYSDLYGASWELLNRSSVLGIMERLINEGLSTRTRNKYLSAIKGVAKESFVAGSMDGDTYHGIKSLKSKPFAPIPTGRELEKFEVDGLKDGLNIMIHDADSSKDHAKRDMAIVYLLSNAALRRIEVTRLKLSDVDAEKSRIKILGKGGKQRLVPMGPITLESVLNWIDARKELVGDVDQDDDGPLFVSINRWGQLNRNQAGGDKRKLKGITSGGISDIIDRKFLEFGITNAGTHDFRRSLITGMLDNGIPIDTVADFVGHSSVDTTRIYDKGKDKRMEEALRQFESGIE